MDVRYKIRHFKTKEEFENVVVNKNLEYPDNIYYNDIIFISDTLELYTHGKIYDCNTYNGCIVKSMLNNIVKEDILDDFGLITLDDNDSESLIAAKLLNSINNISAEWITDGEISIERLPAGALERMYIFDNEISALNKYNSGEIQEGDMVLITENGDLMYYCIGDGTISDSFLDIFKEFRARYAASVPWSGITNMPSWIVNHGEDYKNLLNALETKYSKNGGELNGDLIRKSNDGYEASYSYDGVLFKNKKSGDWYGGIKNWNNYIAGLYIKDNVIEYYFYGGTKDDHAFRIYLDSSSQFYNTVTAPKFKGYLEGVSEDSNKLGGKESSYYASLSELNNKFTKNNIKSTLGISDWALASSLEWGTVNGRPTLLSQFTDDIVAGKYLSLTGGNLSGNIIFNSERGLNVKYSDNSEYNAFRLTESGTLVIGHGTSLGKGSTTQVLGKQIWLKAAGDNDVTLMLNADHSASFKGNVTAPSFIGNLTGNADSATKLASNDKAFAQVSGNNILFGWELAPDGYDTLIAGRNIQFRNGVDKALAMDISAVGDVVVHNKLTVGGTISGNLQGNADSTTKLAAPRKIWGQNFDGTRDVSGSFFSIGTYGGFALYGGIRENEAVAIEVLDSNGSWKRNGITLLQNGNVAIGAVTASEKLEVHGNVKATKFIGDLGGNADRADVLAKTYSENINYRAGSKMNLICYTSAWESDGFPNNYTAGLSVMTDYVGWQMVTYGGDIENPYFRSFQDSRTWKPWKQLAFITDNVASATKATKLATPRTIWGKSFDGSGDVSGDMHLNTSSMYWHHDKAHYCLEPVFREDTSTFLKIAYYGGIRFDTLATARMCIKANGNVGIGIEDPTSKLHVAGDVNIDGDILLQSTATVGIKVNDIYTVSYDTSINYLQIGYGQNDVGGGTTLFGDAIAMRYGSNMDMGFILTSSGNVGIGINTPTEKLEVNGNVKAIDFITTSDNRLKTFIKDVDINFESLKTIPKKYYYWKDKSMGENLQIGTSAQELIKIYPECVSYNENEDKYSVNYQKLSIIALAAIDKLYDRIVELENKLKTWN